MLDALSSFGAPSAIGTMANFSLLSTKIYELIAIDPHLELAAALSVPVGVFTLILLWIQQRLIRPSRFVTLTGKSVPDQLVDLGAWRHLVMALVYPLLPRVLANGKRAVVACVDDELHDLGARMVADFFEMAGFGVRYLGANLPTDGLIGIVREDPPDLVVLSVTMAFHLDAAREAVPRLREAVGDRLRVGLGGQAFA